MGNWVAWSGCPRNSHQAPGIKSYFLPHRVGRDTLTPMVPDTSPERVPSSDR